MRLWKEGIILAWLIVPACYAAPPDREQVSFASLGNSSEWTTDLEWDLTREPSLNTTGHWIFDNVNSLLQHWPNTRLRNGHTIVPGVIPTGTLLYHGTYQKIIPATPEWAAMDPDHSYVFCRSIFLNKTFSGSDQATSNNFRERNEDEYVDEADRGHGCWHLTMVATRPLKVLYFDGSSAAKMWGGPLDSQDILLWGEIRDDRAFDEELRIKDLCEWGRELAIDAYVRMEMDFEIMVCDFTAGLEEVSFLHLPSVNLDMVPPPTPRTPAFRVLESGKWHDKYPGETRVIIDYTRILSFYDTGLFPTLHAQRILSGKDRWDHNLEHISPREIQTLRGTLKRNLRGEWGRSTSGVDWKTLLSVISDRYRDRLELLHYVLWNSTESQERKVEDVLKEAQRHLKSMLIPYILYPLYPKYPKDARWPPSTNGISDRQWASPIFKECAMTHIRYMDSPSMSSKLTGPEKTLGAAVKDVSKEICRVLVGMWAEGVQRGLVDDSTERPPGRWKDGKSDDYRDLVVRWRKETSRLMEWLDWSYWVRCKPACQYEYMCYMPTWPFFKKWPKGPRPGHPDGKNHSRSLDMFVSSLESSNSTEEPGPDDDWYHPTPRCIRRLEPFGVSS